MAGQSKTVVYQASITLQASLARVEAAREMIARMGGQVELVPTQTPGLIIVRLLLPEGVPPEAVVPGVPFFRV